MGTIHIKPWLAAGFASLAIVCGAITSGLGYVVWFEALKGLDAARAATVQLAVPALAAAGGAAEEGAVGEELLLGVLVGVVIPLATIRLEQSRFFAAAGPYERLNGFAIGLLVYAIASTTHANLFLAAFVAGVTVASRSPPAREAFHDFGEVGAALFERAALYLFGTLLIPAVV